MSDTDNQLIRLQDLRQFRASGSLEESLASQAGQAARLVGAESCSIMLLNHGDGDDMRMRVCACHGSLPAAAMAASIGKGDGISGRVLVSGRALLVEDISASELAPLARRPDDHRRSLMAAPVYIDGKVAGVVNVCGAQGKIAFRQDDLHLLDVISLFIGKSIQVHQLQGLLDSRFAQMALMQELQDKAGKPVLFAYRNPDEVARILAKSFFKEMTKAGFGSNQIVNAASELLAQLNHSLQRHRKRVSRNEANNTGTDDLA